MKHFLQKAAALALAVCMLASVSVYAFPDGLSYEDAEAETAQESAIYGLLYNLEIMVGSGHGNFEPERELTRAEMAKILFVLHSGGESSAEAYHHLETPFTDIEDTWAEDYIRYGYANGLFLGTSGNSFSPTDLLDGYQCAKMLLSALDYPFDSESNWQNQVTEYLRSASTIKGEALADSAALSSAWTRDEVAHLIYQVLHTNMYGTSTTMIKQVFALDYYSGYIQATDELALSGTTAPLDSIYLSVTNTDATSEKLTFSSSFSFDYRWIGRSVDVYSYTNRTIRFIFDNDEITQLTTGKSSVSVDGQSVTVTGATETYQHSFSDEEWSSTVPFIHSFYPAIEKSVADLFSSETNYLVGHNSDRIVIGYTSDGTLLYALAFSNTFDVIEEINADENGTGTIKISDTLYEIGDLDDATVGDYVIYSISGSDGKLYASTLETVTLSGLRYDSTSGNVYYNGEDGSELLADFAADLRDPSGLLIAPEEYADFAAKETQTVLVFSDLIYTVID